MTRTDTLALALAPLLFLAACTDASKAPAEAALKAAETAVASLGEEVEKLAPEQVQGAREALASARAFVAKQDYKGALAAAGEIPAKARAAMDAAQARKDEAARAVAEAQKAFADATAALGGRVTALKARVAALARAKKLPRGLTQATVKKAKATLKSLEDGAARLATRFQSDAAGAIAEAGALLKKAADLARKLQMK